MFDTLERLLDQRGPGAKAVVWAHNSHVGDARATEMGAAGLVAAIRTLLRRGGGAQAWVSPYRHDPIAFLIDAVSSPVRVWSSEEKLMFENAASRGRRDVRSLGKPDQAEQEATGRRIERRILVFQHKGDELTLEVFTSSVEDSGPRT